MAKRIKAYDAFEQMEHDAQGSKDPGARPFKPAIMDGDYPGPEAVKNMDPDGSEYVYYQDAHAEEQARRLHALEAEGGSLGGKHPDYPDRATPRSPEQYAAEQEQAAYLRAAHGGLEDAPGEAQAVAQVPFKLKG